MSSSEAFNAHISILPPHYSLELLALVLPNSGPTQQGRGRHVNDTAIGTNHGERKVISDVAEFGWCVLNVLEDDGHPPWWYTIGFYETWQHPEIIIVGRSRATAHHVLNSLANDFDAHRSIDLDESTYNLIPKAECHFVEVAARYYQDYVGFARWYYDRRHFPLYQIVWPYEDGRYPWDPNVADANKEWQPLLGKPPKTMTARP